MTKPKPAGASPPPETNETLHETVLTTFNKTASGKIFEKELKDIYCMMIICLDLKDESNRFQFNVLSKYHPFSFLPAAAVSAMNSLNVKIDLSTTTTQISYSIKEELAKSLLKKFFDAKLLHCPVDRTRSEPKAGVVLQPTAKGIAVVQDFCRKVGMNRSKWPPILFTSFNSMSLFKFDRNPITDKITYSDYLLRLLFAKMLGPSPNIWSPTNKPEIVTPNVCLDTSEDVFGFSMNTVSFQDMTEHGFEAITRFYNQENSSSAHADSKSAKLPPKSTSFKSKFNHLGNHNHLHAQQQKSGPSPYHHRFFTNPESDSHMQYYTSDRGVRLFKERTFTLDNGDVVTPELCITGKAICQWLCDCTDIISTRHAIEISQLFLDAKFLKPISGPTSNADAVHFRPGRESFYTISSIGKAVCDWSPNRTGLSFKHAKLTKLKPVRHRHHSKDLSSDLLDSLTLTSSASTQSDDFESASSNVFVQALALQSQVPESAVSSQIALPEVIKDPGMRYLFRCHLEKEFCSENLDAYLQLSQFSKQTAALGKMLQYKNSRTELSDHESSMIDEKIMVSANLTFALAYNIFFTYLSAESPFVLNIVSSLRERITAIMLNQEPPVSTKDQFSTYLRTPISEKRFNFEVSTDAETELTEAETKLVLPESSTDVNKENQADIMLETSERTTNISHSQTDLATLSLEGSKSNTDGERQDNNDSKRQDITDITDSEKEKNGSAGHASIQTASSSSSSSSWAAEGNITKIVETLSKISEVFELINQGIYRLMEIDSYPKFLNSELCQNAFAKIDIR